MSVAIDADGRFSGYASVFRRIDGGGDIVMPGAFRDTLKSRGADRVRLLFQHDPKEPVGLWDEIVEDRFGLKTGGWARRVPRSFWPPWLMSSACRWRKSIRACRWCMGRGSRR